MFLSTFEKQLDLKRRIVVPQEFRAAVSGPFDGVFCFPSIEADCIEGGGKALFDRYNGVIEELPFGDPLRSALETSVLGGMVQLSFDTAGRITLPDLICKAFGLTDPNALTLEFDPASHGLTLSLNLRADYAQQLNLDFDLAALLKQAGLDSTALKALA